MKPKRVFMEGVRGGHTKESVPLWIIEDWIPWQYYTGKYLDRWMHYLRKIPGARFLVDEVWETRYYPLFNPIKRQYTIVTWDKVGERWDWAKERNDRIRKDQES